MIVLWSLWSGLVWTFSFVWMLLVCLYCFPLALVVPFHRWQHLLPASMLGLVPRFTGSTLDIVYDERFDPTRRCVFVQNHVAMIDGHIALAAIRHPFCGVENEAHYQIPLYGWLMRLGGGIRVPRTPGGRLNCIIAQARERVGQRNMSVLVMPEGGRSLDGSLKPFHRGGFFLARDLGLPVVPLAVRGLYQVMHKGSALVRPGRIEVYVGPQVETAGLSDAQVETLTIKMRRALGAWIDRKQPVGKNLAGFLTANPHELPELLAPDPALAIQLQTPG
jgi:1-acyl-sn-glycerol-3-phosphate acyltransferase